MRVDGNIEDDQHVVAVDESESKVELRREFPIISLMDVRLPQPPAYEGVPVSIREEVVALTRRRNVCPEAEVYEIDEKVIQLLSPYRRGRKSESTPAPRRERGVSEVEQAERDAMNESDKEEWGELALEYHQQIDALEMEVDERKFETREDLDAWYDHESVTLTGRQRRAWDSLNAKYGRYQAKRHPAPRQQPRQESETLRRITAADQRRAREVAAAGARYVPHGDDITLTCDRCHRWRDGTGDTCPVCGGPSV